MAFYDITPAQLAQAAIGTAYAVIYTVPTNTRTFVKDIVVANTTTGSIDIYIHLVPASSGVGTGTIAGTTMTITAMTSGRFEINQTISGSGVTAAAISDPQTGIGGVGTYQVSVSQTVATAVTITGTATVDTSNAIYYKYALTANTTLHWVGAQIMNDSGTIQVKASATGCAVSISGGEAV
jgi:hypothetical protein